jgi:hypothetical protein
MKKTEQALRETRDGLLVQYRALRSEYKALQQKERKLLQQRPSLPPAAKSALKASKPDNSSNVIKLVPGKKFPQSYIDAFHKMKFNHAILSLGKSDSQLCFVLYNIQYI